MVTQILLNLLHELNKANLSSLVETISSHCDGYVIKFKDGSDVAIHKYTCGHEEFLWDSYRMPQDYDDVTGWLTSTDIVK